MRNRLMKLQNSILLTQKKLDLQKISMSVTIKAVRKDLQIVTGEVYAPYIIDSHGEMMTDEDVEYMAHQFVSGGLEVNYDVYHNNRVIDAKAVESWIARGHPDWNEGAWVLSTKINDKLVWRDAKSGKLGGYSIEAMVRKEPAIAEYEISPSVFGYTEDFDSHNHVFYAQVDANGVVVGGYTSKDAGHRHVIKFGTRTEIAQDHTHRFFLP